MDDLEYKKKILDTKSASFCGAKWYNATIWLGSGMTTSCHHPLPHKIDLEEIKTNPSAIHNTRQKKEQRRQMQCGERPKGCEYCWKNLTRQLAPLLVAVSQYYVHTCPRKQNQKMEPKGCQMPLRKIQKRLCTSV